MFIEKPGFKIIRTPKNPIIKPNERRGVNFSLRNIIANTVANTGAVKFKEVTMDIGVILKPKKKSSIAIEFVKIL